MPSILVVGARGSIGSEVAAHFGRLADWNVHGLSRGAPVLGDAVRYQHLSVDLERPVDCVRAVRALERPITHVVYTALTESPGLVSGWSDQGLMQRNLAMMQNILEPVAAAGSLEHVIAMQGAKAYGVHLHSIHVPARESEPRDPHPNFYWLQEDFLRGLQGRTGCRWTIFRPQILLSGAVGVYMNPVPVIGAYAAVCAEERVPCGFPGNLACIWEATDARLLARACEWAFEHSTTEQSLYNITNGDVWVIAHQWSKICAMLRVDEGPPRHFDFAEFISTKSDVWKRVAERHRLRTDSLARLVGESHHYFNILCGNFPLERDLPALLSTIKIRQAGFSECIDTDVSLARWFEFLRRHRWLPTPETA